MIKFGDKCRLWLCVLVFSMLLIGLTITPVAAAMGSDDEITAAMEEVSISQIVDELIDYYKEKKIINWEEIVALGLADEDLSKHNAEYNIGEWDSGNYDQPTDYATKILANLALGNDPASYNERDLIEGLTELQQENGSFGGGANNSVWSIIALDGALAAGCEVSYELEKAVAFLISQQTADGGYTLMGDTGDPDMTGDVLLALGRYKNVLEVSESIDRAVAFLKDIQLDTAGYASWGSENSQSIAKVMVGLLAIGENPLDESWSKDGRTMVDALLGFQLADNSFAFLAGDKQDDMATRQAFRALVELKNAGHEDFIINRNIRDAAQEPEENLVTVRVRVEGHTQSLADEVLTISGTALDALKVAVGEAEVDDPDGFINGIMGESGKTINEDISTFWMHYIIRNGVIDIEAFNHGAGGYNLKDGDEVVFYITAFDSKGSGKTYFPVVSVSPSAPIEDQALQLGIDAKKYTWSDGLVALTNDESNEIGEYAVTVGTGQYITVNGELAIPHLEAATYSYEITNYNDAGYPNVVAAKGSIKVNAAENPVEEPEDGDTSSPVPDSKVRIHVEVTGKSRTYYSGTVELSKGRSSAIDALAATGVGYRVRDGGYVYEIAGEKEDLSTTAGWKYKVGSQIPGSSAGDYILKDGDNLLWFWAGDYTSTDPSKGGSGGSVEDELYELKEQEELPVKEEISSTIKKAIGHFGNSKLSAVVGQDNPLSEEEKVQLQETLKNNVVAIKQKVAAGIETAVTDSKNEICLTIAKNALKAGEVITVKEIEEDNNVRESGSYKQLTSVFEFGPKGIIFEEPVHLSVRIAIPSGVNAENLTLAWYDADKEEWIPLPTVIDLSTGTVTGLIEHFTRFAVLEKIDVPKTIAGFSDVTIEDLPWAVKEINHLAARGIIQGVGGDQFAPISDITRAEFTALMVKALELDCSVEYDGAFGDVAGDAWHHGYIQAAVKAGLVKGTSDETFGPNEVITREQLAVMMARIIPTDKDASGAGFKDAPEIASWAVDSVNRVVFLGLFNGFPDDSFRPKEPVSRAQAAVVIYRYLAGS